MGEPGVGVHLKEIALVVKDLRAPCGVAVIFHLARSA